MAQTRKHGSRTKKHHAKRHTKKHAKKHTKKHSTKGYRKGSKSKTMKGRKDFTTKKSSKVFNRRGHYQKHAQGSKKNRRPYAKRGGSGWTGGEGEGVHWGTPTAPAQNR